MGIANAKTCSGQPVFVVQRGTLQFPGALGIDENLRPQMLDNRIRWLRGVDLHDVLQTCASAFLDGQAKALP